jgi:hypothetical protein
MVHHRCGKQDDDNATPPAMNSRFNRAGNSSSRIFQCTLPERQWQMALNGRKLFARLSWETGMKQMMNLKLTSNAARVD